MTARDRQLDLNREVEDQTNRIRMMNRVAAQTSDTTNNVMRELGDQKEKIKGQITMSDEIKNQIKSADSKTKQMNRRNLCIKCALYLVIIVLFAVMVFSLIFKLTNKS